MTSQFRVLAYLSATLLLFVSAPAVASSPSKPAANPASLATYLARISRAADVTIYAVTGVSIDCSGHPEWAAKTIDCHEIMRRVTAPSVAWRDSLARILTHEGSLGPLADQPCIGDLNVVLLFVSGPESTRVWMDTGCASLSMHANGLPSVRANPNRIVGELKAMFRPLFANLGNEPDDFPARNDPPPVEEAPRIVTAPPIPMELMTNPHALADTVRYLVRVGKDGRVKYLRLRQGVPGMDSLVAAHLLRGVYRPALIAKRPVPTWIQEAIAVPRRRGNREPREVPAETKCECGSTAWGPGEFVYFDEAPVPTVKPTPIYPKDARDGKVQGKVMLHVLVDHLGTPCRIKVIRGIDLLDDAAVKAVSQWRFKPARARGKPACVWVEVPMEFRL